MDRRIVFAGQVPLDSDLLFTNKSTMIALGMLAKAVLGNGTLVDGLECTPTGPASLNVLLASGSIMSNQNVDGTAYGSLGSDTTNQIVKQGIRLSSGNIPASGTFAVPSTSGFSVNYLIQVQYQDVDGGSTVLPYYNASNPAVAYNGPANAGTPNNTVRFGSLIVSVKAGTAATSGSQVTPTPDAGYTGLWVVTVANGATTIISGNIARYTTGDSNPAILEKLRDKISQTTADGRYVLSGGSGGAVRSSLSNATTYYVSSTGNDTTGDGSNGNPWATVSHAWNYVTNQIDQRGFRATIQLQDTGSTTTYAGASGTPSPTGPITIQGNTGNPTRVVLAGSSADGFLAVGGSPYDVTLQFIQVSASTSGWGVRTGFARVFLNGVTFGACASGNISCSGASGYVGQLGTITFTANAPFGINTFELGEFDTLGEGITLTGTPVFATAFTQATDKSLQLFRGTTFTGSATGPRAIAVGLSLINTGTGSDAVLPGNSSVAPSGGAAIT